MRKRGNRFSARIPLRTHAFGWLRLPYEFIRKRCVFFSDLANPAKSFVERVARATHGADRIIFAVVRQSLAQSANVNVDSALVDFRRKPPNAVEQLRAGKDPAWLSH